MNQRKNPFRKKGKIVRKKVENFPFLQGNTFLVSKINYEKKFKIIFKGEGFLISLEKDEIVKIFIIFFVRLFGELLRFLGWKKGDIKR
jgi:hypothetical protein